MTVKNPFQGIGVSGLALLVIAGLAGLSCNSTTGFTNTVAGSSDPSGSSSELAGPIEQLSPSNGAPTQLRIYGVNVNIQGARIELDSSILLDPRDLAPTQFVEVDFAALNIASLPLRWR